MNDNTVTEQRRGREAGATWAEGRPSAVSPADVAKFVNEIIGADVHARTVASVIDGVVGVVGAPIVAIHAIGRALAIAVGLDPKHATKQFDRLLSNAGFDVWNWFNLWVPYVLRGASEITIALDWTDFDADGHATLAASVVTSHGRASPLLWKSVDKSSLKGRQGEYEREVLSRLEELIPEGLRVLLVADRGFGNQDLFAFLGLLGWDYCIRFKQGTHISVRGAASAPAADFIPANGHAKMLRDVLFTQDETPIGAVVLKHQKGMKEPWCIATNRADLGAANVVQRYAHRFTIEETFRDIKDIRFGLGLSATHIGDRHRRDRLLFLCAIAQLLLTLLGAAGETAGIDKYLKVNTSKSRTLSLFKQGAYWYAALPTLADNRLRPLIRAFRELLRDTPPIAFVFGPEMRG